MSSIRSVPLSFLRLDSISEFLVALLLVAIFTVGLVGVLFDARCLDPRPGGSMCVCVFQGGAAFALVSGESQQRAGFLASGTLLLFCPHG